jgi:hypothetical protein
MPTESMLRTICAGASSKLTNRVRSFRRLAASTKAAESVVFAVPGEPVMRVELPR